MSLYRTIHKQLPSTKFLLWISLMGISTARYNVNIQYLGILLDETMAVEISQHQFSICQEANGQFCNIYPPLQLLANPPPCITALLHQECSWHFHQMFTTNQENSKYLLPLQTASNVWILTSAPSTVKTTITLICLGETTKFIYSKETHPHLMTTTSLQCYITTLSSTTTL